MKRKNDVNYLTWGLFDGSFMQNIAEIPIVISRLCFVLKHGYYPQARYVTNSWFIDVMTEILTEYRYNRIGSLVVNEELCAKPKLSDKELMEIETSADELFDNMIDLLNKMDERNPIYENKSTNDKELLMENAKENFFILFSKYFYDLWD